MGRTAGYYLAPESGLVSILINGLESGISFKRGAREEGGEGDRS